MYKSHNPYDRARSLAEREEALEELLRLTRKKYPPYFNDSMSRSCSGSTHRKQTVRKRPSCSHHLPEHNDHYYSKHDHYHPPPPPEIVDEFYHERKPDHTPRSRARTWLNKLFHSPPPEPKRITDDDIDLHYLKSKITHKSKIPKVKLTSRPMIIPSTADTEQVVIVDIPLNATVVVRFLDDDSKPAMYQTDDNSPIDELFKTLDIKSQTKKSSPNDVSSKQDGGMARYLSVPTQLSQKSSSSDKKYHYFDSDDSVEEDHHKGNKPLSTSSSSTSDFSSSCSTPITEQDSKPKLVEEIDLKKKLNRWMR